MEHPRDNRWAHLCLIADRIRSGAGAEGQTESLLPLLESVLEVFPKDLDPVSDFEGYAVRQFAKSLSGALERLASGKT